MIVIAQLHQYRDQITLTPFDTCDKESALIKTVIFDLSEVLIPGLIGIEQRLEVITGKPSDLIAKALGNYPFHEIDNILESLLKGTISYQEYRSHFLANIGLANSYEDVFDQQCLKMFETPYAHTKDLIQRVSQTCDLYLLSDHCEMFATHIQKNHSFFRYFKGTLWSYEVSATKKSEVPFVALIDRYSLTPSECLFVDDNKVNISVAETMGFPTVHFLGAVSIPQIYQAISNG